MEGKQVQNSSLFKLLSRLMTEHGFNTEFRNYYIYHKKILDEKINDFDIYTLPNDIINYSLGDEWKFKNDINLKMYVSICDAWHKMLYENFILFCQDLFIKFLNKHDFKNEFETFLLRGRNIDSVFISRLNPKDYMKLSDYVMDKIIGRDVELYESHYFLSMMWVDLIRKIEKNFVNSLNVYGD